MISHRILSKRLFSSIEKRNRVSKLRLFSYSFIGFTTLTFSLYLTIPYSKFDRNLKEELDRYQYSKFKIKDIQNISDDAKLFTIDLPSNKLTDQSINVGYIQHLYIKQPHIQIERPFTPLEVIKADSKDIKLLIKQYDRSEMTNYLSNLTIGDDIELRGPGLTLNLGDIKDKSNLVFILGGTGISIFKQSIDYLLKDQTIKSIKLIYSFNRNCYFKDDLQKLEKQSDKLTVNFNDTSITSRLNKINLFIKLGLNYFSSDNLYIICGNKLFNRTITNNLNVNKRKIRIL